MPALKTAPYRAVKARNLHLMAWDERRSTQDGGATRVEAGGPSGISTAEPDGLVGRVPVVGGPAPRARRRPGAAARGPGQGRRAGGPGRRRTRTRSRRGRRRSGSRPVPAAGSAAPSPPWPRPAGRPARRPLGGSPPPIDVFRDATGAAVIVLEHMTKLAASVAGFRDSGRGAARPGQSRNHRLPINPAWPLAGASGRPG